MTKTTKPAECFTSYNDALGYSEWDIEEVFDYLTKKGTKFNKKHVATYLSEINDEFYGFNDSLRY